MSEATENPHMLYARLMVVEKQMESHEKIHDAILKSMTTVDGKLDDIRIQMARLANLPDLERKMAALEHSHAILRADFQEGTWMRKLGYSLVAASMLALLGFAVSTSNYGDKSMVGSKLADEYKR